MSLPRKPTAKRIVIIGGSFAGLMAAARISCSYDVTVIDARDAFEWIPNIHEILSGVKARRGLVLNRAPSISRHGHRFVHASVSRIDSENNQVCTADGEVYPYDACLIAAGSQSATYGVAGAEQHAMALRQVEDAERIASRLDQLARRRRPASVVVVGGGISGMESVGEILRRRHRDEHFRLHIVERSEQLFSQQPEALAADATRRCLPYSVQIHTGTAVSGVEPRRVVLDNGHRLTSDLCLWTAGLALPAFLNDPALKDKRDPWLPVRQSLQSRLRDNLFVAGDCAHLPQPIRKQAYFAMDMGEVAGANLVRYLEGRKLLDFKPASTPVLISFGDLTTWLVAGGNVIANPLLAAAKEGVYQATMARFDSPWHPVNYAAGAVGRALRAAQKLALPQLNARAVIDGLLGTRVSLARP